jgi:hypothetical protein
MNTKQRVIYIQKNRSNLDKFVIKAFKKVFLRYADRHLTEAQMSNVINNDQLHTLDAQMKGDLGFKGYI